MGYPPSRLELRLRPKGKKTELTMIHSKVRADRRTDTRKGGRNTTGELKKYLAKGWA